MNYDRSTGDNAGIIMQLDVVIHLMKHLSVLFVQIQSNCFHFVRSISAAILNEGTVLPNTAKRLPLLLKRGITKRRVGWIEETTELRKV